MNDPLYLEYLEAARKEYIKRNQPGMPNITIHQFTEWHKLKIMELMAEMLINRLHEIRDVCRAYS